MTVKEIVDKTTMNDVIDVVAKMSISIFYEDFPVFIDVYNEFKNSTEDKKKFSLTFFDGPYDFPYVMKVFPKGRREALVTTPKAIANCDIFDKTGKLSEVEMLTFLMLHFVALREAESPQEFLLKRFNTGFNIA